MEMTIAFTAGINGYEQSEYSPHTPFPALQGPKVPCAMTKPFG
jgi:hypothetical protein